LRDDSEDAAAVFVRAAAQLAGMPLTADRERAVASTMSRIALFAADLEAFPLGDDVEIAGVFTP
jgi:hypothetical protein